MEIIFNKSVAHLTLAKSVTLLEVQCFNDLERDHIQWSSKQTKCSWALSMECITPVRCWLCNAQAKCILHLSKVFISVFQGISICTKAKCLEHNEMLSHMPSQHIQFSNAGFSTEKLSPLLLKPAELVTLLCVLTFNWWDNPVLVAIASNACTPLPSVTAQHCPTQQDSSPCHSV